MSETSVTVLVGPEKTESVSGAVLIAVEVGITKVVGEMLCSEYSVVRSVREQLGRLNGSLEGIGAPGESRDDVSD